MRLAMRLVRATPDRLGERVAVGLCDHHRSRWLEDVINVTQAARSLPPRRYAACSAAKARSVARF